jgi:hypothetical protein
MTSEPPPRSGPEPRAASSLDDSNVKISQMWSVLEAGSPSALRMVSAMHSRFAEGAAH